MNLTIFKIAKMDCPSEEQLIRMKLSDIKQIKNLKFDLANRKLEVYHTDDYNEIFDGLNSLNLDTTLISTEKSNDLDNNITLNSNDRKLLWIVLSINLFFFFVEIIAGFVGSSMGLVADSFDMLADSIVYSLALYAVGGSLIRKKKIAKYAGIFQLMIAILGLIEVIRRFIGLEEFPVFQLMITISLLALLGNVASLFFLQKSKNKEAHIKASLIFTTNDVIANIGVIVAGVLVYITNSKYPDLIIGSIVFLIVFKGAINVFNLSK